MTSSFTAIIVALTTLATLPCLAGPKATVESDRLSASLCAQIRKKDETHTVVSEAAVRTAMENTTALTRTARLMPEITKGAVIGFRIVSIQPGSPVRCLGLKKGDVIQAINDVDITRPDTALRIYPGIRAAIASGVVRISMLRKNLPFVLEVTIE